MDISINKVKDIIVTTSVGTSSNPRNRVIHLGLQHFNPPSLNGKLIEKTKSWEEQHYVLQKEKGKHTQAKTSEATMNYSFLALKILLLQCIQEGQYIALQREMEGRVQAFSRNMEGQETRYSDPYEEKSKNTCLHAHFPMYQVLAQKLCMHASMAL